jgi:5-methylcytosine-specific restriction protein A
MTTMFRAALDFLAVAGTGRSPQWPALRRKHLAQFPACAACGTREGVEVHHVYPVHAYPHLELEPLNCLTLCKAHHLWHGHLGDFRSWCPSVLADCRSMLAKVKNRPYKEPTK